MERAWAKAKRAGANFRLSENKTRAPDLASLIFKKARSRPKLEVYIFKGKARAQSRVKCIFHRLGLK